MANWGCYDLHYVLSVINWQVTPRTLLAQMWPIGAPFADYAAAGSDAETHLAMLVQCADDIAITYERGELLAAPVEKAWDIIGENGSLALHMTGGEGKQIVFHHRRPGGHGTVSDVIWSGDEDGQVAHQGTIDAFGLAIQRGNASPKPMRQALFVQSLTDAAYRSAQEQQAVPLGLDDHGASLTLQEIEATPTAGVPSAANAG